MWKFQLMVVVVLSLAAISPISLAEPIYESPCDDAEIFFSKVTEAEFCIRRFPDSTSKFVFAHKKGVSSLGVGFLPGYAADKVSMLKMAVSEYTGKHYEKGSCSPMKDFVLVCDIEMKPAATSDIK